MSHQLLSVIAEYRAGLEAEMTLLHQLEALAGRQQQATLSGDMKAMTAIGDTREGILANLVTLEYEMKPLRLMLLDKQEALQDTPQFKDVVTFHREAARLVATILTSDERSMAMLKDAERARRTASRGVEKGENTLAAYRRVIAPAVASATLVNRRG